MRGKLVIIAAVLSLMLTGCAVELGDVPGMLFPSEDINESTAPHGEDMTAEQLYDLFTGELRQYRTKVTIRGSISAELITETMDAIQRRAPDIFWIDGYTITTGSRTTEVVFDSIDSLTPVRLREMSAELEAAADELISQIPEDMLDYDKILYIHDTIIRSTTYDQKGSGAGKNGLWGTAYGCLVNGDAICQGYSEAFVYIMGKLGIEAGMCSGTARNERHAWNYVKLGAEYYWIDLTWDDPESTDDTEDIGPEGYLRHTYFLINDEMLLRTRTIDPDQDYIPECSSIANNYFVRSNSYFDTYSIEALGWVMLQNAGSRSVEVMFSDSETFEYAVGRLFDDGDIWETGEYLSLADKISYSRDDVMLVLTINY